MITQLDTENADLDLTALITVLTDTPDASNAMICQGLVMLGDGVKDLDGTGGAFELVITVGGQTVQPSPQVVTFGTEVRSSVWTVPFPVPANTEVILRVKSPNGADTDVDVTADLYDVSASADVTASHATTDALIDGIGTAGGAAISVDAAGDNYGGGIAGVTSATTKVGTQTATYAATSVLDGTPHIMTHAAQDVDIVYQFLTGGGTSPVSIIWTGLINPNNDTLTISAWNHVGVAWEVIGTVDGQTSTTAMVVKNLVLYARHMGTSAAELGKVYLRLNSVAAYNHIVRTDQVYLEYAITSRTVGYADGAIWVDTVNGTAGTENFVNGTADNPVLTWADALTLSASLGIKRFHIINGSTVTLSGNSDHFTLIGSNWTLALNGQSCSDIYVFGSESVTGTCTGATAPEFYQCIFGNATLPPSHLDRCGLTGTITAGSAGSFTFDACYSLVSGVSAPIFDFGAAIANEDVHMRHYSGGLQIQNLGATGTDSMSLEGHGQLILNASCSAGTIALRGHFTITDNVVGGFVVGGGVISDDARYDVSQINAEADTALTDYGGALATVCTEGRLAELDAANLPTDVGAIPTTAMRGTDSAALATVCTEGRLAELDAANLPTDIAAIPTTAMRGTDSAALASVCTEARLAELAAANLPADIAAIPTTAMRGTDGVSLVVPDAAGVAAAAIAAAVTSLKGADGDTLKTLSDQIDPLVPGAPTYLIMGGQEVTIS